MCLQTEWKKPKKADEDIIVYKLVDYYNDGTITSPYEYFEYELNKTYSTTMLETDDISSFDGEACEAIMNNYGKYISIGPGFHSALTKKRLKHVIYGSMKVAKCIIPKGSLYYKGYTDLIVSNKIKLVELCP